MFIMIGLLIGFCVLGPPLCWWLGMFNPIGYMGQRPWSAPVKLARSREAEQLRRWAHYNTR
jgi:hypothetical protein